MLTSVHRINLPRAAYPRERGVRVAGPRIVELLSSAPTSIRFSHRYRRRIDVVFSPGNPGPPGVIRRSPCIKPVPYRGAWVIGVCPQHRRVNPLTLKLRELRVHRDTSARKVTTWGNALAPSTRADYRDRKCICRYRNTTAAHIRRARDNAY